MDICQVCRQTLRWHEENKPRHEFIRLGESPNIHEREVPAPTPLKSGDPVLRMALMKLGVLTETDLTETETWIRHAAEQGMAVTVVEGEFKLLTIEEWIGVKARVS